MENRALDFLVEIGRLVNKYDDLNVFELLGVLRACSAEIENSILKQNVTDLLEGDG